MRSEKTVAAVGDMFQNNPRGISWRRNDAGISASFFHRILKKSWHPCHLKKNIISQILILRG